LDLGEDELDSRGRVRQYRRCAQEVDLSDRMA
jgi:hypothetical protein